VVLAMPPRFIPMMTILSPIADAIDRLNRTIGRTFSWLVAIIVVLQTAIVILRYAFGVGDLAAADVALYANAILYMSVAAWVLQLDEHVRVDVLYRLASPRGQALLNLVGIVFFIWPLIYAMAVFGWPYVTQSWKIREAGSAVSGLGMVYVLKTFIIVFAVLVGLQSIAYAIRCLETLTGRRA
jgi:TRAP-type mannitol/chloroaromatic compound transport system permease small subunit